MTVVVSPENMQGWTIATNRGAFAGLVNYGSAIYEREKPWIAENGSNLGRGAFYATTDFSGADGTPPSAWLGLDTLDGQPLPGVALKRITKLEYYAYLGHIPSSTSGRKEGLDSWAGWSLWYTYPRNPIMLQLTAESPDGKQRKQFWFSPWHLTKAKGENSGTNGKKWLRYDCINFNKPGPHMVSRWYTFGPPEQEYIGWTNLLAVYGDWKLVKTSDKAWPQGWKSPGWDETTKPPGAPTCTGTGKCLNFEVGARKSETQIFGEEVVWQNYYRGFKGYVDHVTIGIDGRNVTYDFEPAKDARAPLILEMSNAAAYEYAAKHSSFRGDLLVKVTGKCIKANAAIFQLDDGSGKIIAGVLCKGEGKNGDGENPAKVGERWTVRGHLEKLSWAHKDAPLCIWTARSHMTKLP